MKRRYVIVWCCVLTVLLAAVLLTACQNDSGARDTTGASVASTAPGDGDPTATESVDTQPSGENPGTTEGTDEDSSANVPTTTSPISVEIGVGDRDDFDDPIETKPNAEETQPVTQPESKPTQPATEATQPATQPTSDATQPTTVGTAPTEPSTTLPSDPKDMTIEQFEAMSGKEQDEFIKSFPHLKDYIAWWQAAKAAQEATRPTGIEGDGSIDLGDLIP